MAVIFKCPRERRERRETAGQADKEGGMKSGVQGVDSIALKKGQKEGQKKGPKVNLLKAYA